ncbi:glycosyl hydrolase family 38 protein [Teladorsagia circumcincta]|uniref:Glycosyl hydrolase family 38 protein n=1 Tax=Teladorsagia circumcincta TaxID=45464 RepID=A0A2G9TZ96_TELCI|nr:glycosyl hydrolase family 38 protein [Teladorsagia circumcincta]
MLDLYDVLSFDNPDGGAWKQGWDVTYDKEKIAEEKTLQVIVLPHSHCDPGWIKTFEEYYHSQTRNILDGMVKHLGEEHQKDMRFIYAEISFLEMWWRDQNDDVRKKVTQLLKDGQLEIVTGGWVMTDEANAHYFSVIAELMEGHEWIRNHIGQDFTPTSHWSIDPFGLSPSIPYLLSAANITNAAIQRVHYSVKKHLARNKQLEFMWRQLWGSHGKADIRTHVFPFYSYDVPHTCGPDPKICCQFDFRRLREISCPWGISPEIITDANVEDRAFLIYDQYRKKSQLYKTNVLLVPLGDDFRYDTNAEWEDQYENYIKLFKEMNNKKEWNVNAFGSLVEARRALSLFQHHDGVTGTAKDYVMKDYGNKMLSALQETEKVLSEAIGGLIGTRTIRQQLSPIFEIKDSHLVASEKYELCFVDQMSAFGVSVYGVIEKPDIKGRLATIMAVIDPAVSGFDFETVKGDKFSLKNDQLEATFSTANGLLQVVNGPIMKKVFVVGSQDLEILQVYSLALNLPSIEIINEVDIRKRSNFELAMRMNTNIQSGNDLYTDLNGLQVKIAVLQF